MKKINLRHFAAFSLLLLCVVFSNGCSEKQKIDSSDVKTNDVGVSENSKENISLSIDSRFEIEIEISEEFNDGGFGDELFFLHSFGGWGGWGSVAVYKNGDKPLAIFYDEDGEKDKIFHLSENDYSEFITYINDNSIDELEDWNTMCVMDGIEYNYIHLTIDTEKTIYINNPDVEIGDSDKRKVYKNLVNYFQKLVCREIVTE